MYLVSAGYPDTYMIPGTYYVPDKYVPGISRQTNVPPVDAHVWRQLHVSAVARLATATYCIFFDDYQP